MKRDGWVFVSGTASSTFVAGEGVEVAGSGSFAQWGEMEGEGQPSGSWQFNGTIEESAGESYGEGTFVEWSVVDGGWVLTDAGGAASGSRQPATSWSGDGTYNLGAFGAVYSRSQADQTTFTWTIHEGYETGVTGTAEEVRLSSGSGSHAGGGTFTIRGATGTYTENGTWFAASSDEVQASILQRGRIVRLKKPSHCDLKKRFGDRFVGSQREALTGWMGQDATMMQSAPSGGAL